MQCREYKDTLTRHQYKAQSNFLVKTAHNLQQIESWDNVRTESINSVCLAMFCNVFKQNGLFLIQYSMIMSDSWRTSYRPLSVN